jgi:hypothetical protein
MRHPFRVFLLAAAAALASDPVIATTTATLTLNGTTRTLTGTGFLSQQLVGVGAQLAPGQSADFTFAYSLSVQDDGLPAPFDPQATGCISIFPTPCGPTYAGFEYAKAFLVVAHEDPRTTHNPALVLEGLRSTAMLETHSDSFAETLTQTGTFHVHLANGDPVTTFSLVFPTYIGLWVLANPIPEPTIVAQLLAGLGLLGVAMGRRSTRPAAHGIRSTRSTIGLGRARTA